ncbi:2'-5' RNA ligase family protein [Streptomyces sp. NPDC004752]
MKGRLFVGLQPPQHLRTRIRQDLAVLDDSPESAWVGADHLHVTLRFLGTVSVDSVDIGTLKAAFAKVTARTVSFGPALMLLGERVLVAPVDGVDDLAAVARASVAKAADVTEWDPFYGHMTVSLPSTAEERNWSQAVVGSALTGGWPVDEVCLFLSANGYQVLERFPLAAAATAAGGEV